MNDHTTNEENHQYRQKWEQGESEKSSLDPQIMHKVYEYLIQQLVLSEPHKKNLYERGFSVEEALRRGYRTFPFSGRGEIAKKAILHFGEEICSLVPGFKFAEGQWSLAGSSGIVLPSRNRKGAIFALKLRADQANEGPKYTYLSSKSYGGKSPISGVHVPIFPSGPVQTVRLTEGELKADYATVSTDILTISIPGVQSWRKGLSALLELRPKVVRLAFDMDAFKNPDVARAANSLARQLAENGFEVIVETWDENFKGIDDAIFGKANIQDHGGPEAKKILQQMLVRSGAGANFSRTFEDHSEEPFSSEEPARGTRWLDKLSPICTTTAKLVEKSSLGAHMTNSERFQLARIAIGARLGDSEIVNFFRKQGNFNGAKTSDQIISIRKGFRLPRCTKLAEDLGYCDGNCAAKKSADASSPNDLLNNGTASSDLPSILTNYRQFRDVISDAWNAVVLANSPEPTIFKRGNVPVRLTEREGEKQIETMGPTEMYGHIIRCASWFKKAKEGVVPVRPDLKVATDMLAAVESPLPALEGVINTPVYSSEGFLISEPGYDAGSALFLDGSRLLNMPNIPENPSKSQLKAASEMIFGEVFHDFCFEDESSRAHAFGALVLYFVRHMISGSTPLHGFEAPTPGTGKGLLVKLISLIAMGRPPAAHSTPNSDEEMRKKITSELMKGSVTLFFDNAPDSELIDSASLAAALTADIWADRVLGVSKTLSLPNKAVWIMTGNNPKLSTEIARRYVRIRLDAHLDRPWERQTNQFRHQDISSWVLENRASLVHAVLTCVQGWIAAGKPKPKIAPLGSFESWSYVVGGILETAGVDGFLKNRSELYEAADIRGQAWREFVSAWWSKFETTAKLPGELNKLCATEGLMECVRGAGGPKSQETVLGKALLGAKGRVFGEFCIHQSVDKGSHGKKYCLSVSPAPRTRHEVSGEHKSSGPQESSQAETDVNTGGSESNDNLDILNKDNPSKNKDDHEYEGSGWQAEPESTQENHPIKEPEKGYPGSLDPLNREGETTFLGEPPLPRPRRDLTKSSARVMSAGGLSDESYNEI